MNTAGNYKVLIFLWQLMSKVSLLFLSLCFCVYLVFWSFKKISTLPREKKVDPIITTMLMLRYAQRAKQVQNCNCQKMKLLQNIKTTLYLILICCWVVSTWNHTLIWVAESWICSASSSLSKLVSRGCVGILGKIKYQKVMKQATVISFSSYQLNAKKWVFHSLQRCAEEQYIFEFPSILML